MKLIFICGSLEPGKDGVGDYTRRLACELMRQGNEVQIIALSDKYIHSSSQGCQSEEAVNIQVLRLSALEHWDERIGKAKNFIALFQPHWLSLQFVPFAFQKKGLPFILAKRLQKIGKGAKWHIMFHELWVGMDKEASLQYKLWGWLQQLLIKSLVKRLQPAVVHTQTGLYQHLLKRNGINAGYLPLFSNILPNKKKDKAAKQNKHEKISFVMFGGIHPGSPIKEFAQDVALFASETKCIASLMFIGKNGAEIQNWTKEWKQNGLQVVILGEQDGEKISEILYQSDYGIATTPASLLGKSGSVAAMLEHQLPVICIAKSWNSRYDNEYNLPTNAFEYKRGNLQELLRKGKPVYCSTSLLTTANQFLNEIQ